MSKDNCGGSGGGADLDERVLREMPSRLLGELDGLWRRMSKRPGAGGRCGENAPGYTGNWFCCIRPKGHGGAHVAARAAKRIVWSTLPTNAGQEVEP